MDDNNDNVNEQEQIELTMSTVRQIKRLNSQIFPPSTNLILRQISGGDATICPVRTSVIGSEQVDSNDR